MASIAGRAPQAPCVLIVDDDRRTLDALAEVLTADRLRVGGTRERGEEVIGAILSAIMRFGTLDVIVMDVDMPVMDGISATRQVKTLFPDVEVILHTTTPLGAAPIEAVGAFAEVVKGDPPAWLVGVVREAARVRQGRLADAHTCRQ